MSLNFPIETAFFGKSCTDCRNSSVTSKPAQEMFSTSDAVDVPVCA